MGPYRLGRLVAWNSVPLGRSLLGADCLASCPSLSSLLAFPPRYRAGWRRLSSGGGVPLACCLLAPASARALAAYRLVPSCCLPRYDYRPVPHIEERGDISRFSCLSRSCLLVDDGIGERAFIVDDIVLVGGGSDNPNIVAVVGEDIGGLVGINLVIPIDVHRELLNDLTNRDMLAGDIAITNGNAVGLADKDVIGLNEVDGFREIVSGHLNHHFGFLSPAPFQHL